MRLIDADVPTKESTHESGRWIYYLRVNNNYVSVCCSECSWLWSGTQEEVNTFKYCPNCGAPITSIECPYCGSVFYDFVTLDSTKPTYVRMVWNDAIIVAHVVMQSASMVLECDSNPDIKVSFMAVPDADGVMIKEERRGVE